MHASIDVDRNQGNESKGGVMGFQRIIAEGYVGKDAELKMFDSGEGVMNFSIGVTEKWKDKKGEKQERTEWLNCAMFGKRAEGLVRYITKGSRILIEGTLRTETYEKNGEKKYITKVVVRDLELLGGKDRPAANASDADDAHDPSIPF